MRPSRTVPVSLIGILLVALALRVWAPWSDVYGERVNFLETDAWYHVRLAENQVRHFPHHVTRDPYASTYGQYIAVAPLFSTTIATAALLTRGPSATTDDIERIAALAPAVMGLAAIVAVWLLARRAFDDRAALLAALMAATLPGHFLDRTLVGFVDHHALEAWLAMATLASLVWALGAGHDTRGRMVRRHVLPGLWLGLYLMGWGSGAMLVAILAAWVVVAALVGTNEDVVPMAKVSASTALVALAIVILFQDPGLFRYDTQAASLVGLGVVSTAVALLGVRVAGRSEATGQGLRVAGVVVLVSAILAAAGVVMLPALAQQVSIDVQRFLPSPSRMAVLESRPLFLYTGFWDWSQPWKFFRMGFFGGLVAAAALAWQAVRSRRLDHLLIVIFTFAMFVATIGQNRFGYYLVPAVSVVMGWLGIVVLDWGGVPHRGNPKPRVRRVIPLQRELAVVLVAGVAVAANLVPAALTTARAGGMPDYWFAAMRWLRTETPEPFGSADYYYDRYTAESPVVDTRAGAYTVMNWWDQGYWLIEAAHRVPVANPTQVRAPNSAKFYTAVDEQAALRILADERAKYVLADFELPFREAQGGALAGRFESLANWSGTPTSAFYSVCYAASPAGFQPVWIYEESYYLTMAYRLAVLGGASAMPLNNTYVVQLQDRVDQTGRPFCEVVSRQVYPNAEVARAAAAALGPRARVVGLTAWQPAFPVPAVTGLRPVQEFRLPGQASTEAPLIRVFEVP